MLHLKEIVSLSVTLSVPTNRHLLATLNFGKLSFPKPPHGSPSNKFLKLNQLRNKPNLHIKGANKVKMRFIP